MTPADLLKLIEEGMRAGILRAREEACARMFEICECIDRDPKFEGLLAQDVLRVQHLTQKLDKAAEFAERAVKALEDDETSRSATQQQGDA